MREVLVRPLALDSRLACALPPRPLVGQGWESQVSQQTRRGVQLSLSPLVGRGRLGSSREWTQPGPALGQAEFVSREEREGIWGGGGSRGGQPRPPLLGCWGGEAWASAPLVWASGSPHGGKEDGGGEEKAPFERGPVGWLERHAHTWPSSGGIELERRKGLWWGHFEGGKKLPGQRRALWVRVLRWQEKATREGFAHVEGLGQLPWRSAGRSTLGGIRSLLWVVCPAPLEGKQVRLSPVQWWSWKVQGKITPRRSSRSCSCAKMAPGKSFDYGREWLHERVCIGSD